LVSEGWWSPGAQSAFTILTGRTLTMALSHDDSTVNIIVVIILYFILCRPSGCTVVSGVIVVVVVGVCNHSQMRTSKCTCLIFGVSIGLDPDYKCTKGIFDRSKFKVTCDISPTISGWLLVFLWIWCENLSCNKLTTN